ncbi:MAG TPA: FtsX-like permease family protein [Tepidisphaeraceae bacterium]|jgi:ABC-type lipoprotein release transport system permease subunit
MTRLGLILRNLAYFRGVNLAVIAGMLVATAVLTGAMMVGDSVRGSLAQLARDRLGKVDQAVISRRFFDQSIVERLKTDTEVGTRFDIVPAVILPGGATTETDHVSAGTVQVLAVGGNWVTAAGGTCIINWPVASALGLKDPGATLLVSLPDKPDEPRDAALSRRAREDTLVNLRAAVAQVHTSQDMISLFDAAGGQRVPQNIWVNLAELQTQIGLGGRVNTLLVHDQATGSPLQAAQLLNAALHRVIRLEDYGLSLSEVGGDSHQAALTSRATYLDPPLVAAAEASGIAVQKVSVNLINTVKLDSSGKSLHYAVAAGVSSLESRELAANEVVINRWTADQLSAQVGDRIRLAFYKRSAAGDLANTNSDDSGFKDGFKIVQILPMSGIGADRTLTPQYKGLTDADTIANWNPPEGIEIDKKRVTKADEDYWRQYRAAPKLLVSFQTAQKLWGGTLGDVTSIRIPADQMSEFRRKLGEKLDPVAMGLAFIPIKAQQLDASGGSTDFGEYFLYFSFFIIVAAVLLVAMLFRLNVEQRARQLGLLAAVGFSPGSLRKLALAEGMALAIVGGLLGIPAAIAYTWLIMYGLRTWWIGAVGTTALYLHIAPLTLVYGYVSGLVVAFATILWAVWQIGRTPAATLLAGGWNTFRRTRRTGRIPRIIGIIFVVAALAIFAASALGHWAADEAFLCGGAIMLIGCLSWLGGALRPGHFKSTSAAGISTVTRLGMRNASRHTARSVLAIGLIAFAAFTLITVAAMKQEGPADMGDVTSGSGGYRLMLSSGIPLLGDLNTAQGRRILGMTDADDALWANAHFVMMRRWAGQDISCLNLTTPTTPTILAVPQVMMRPPDEHHAHRFTFAGTISKSANPWELLNSPSGDDPVPVITDANTAQYILHLDVGQTIKAPDAAGREHQLKLVATLAGSIFQSELLMGEDNFRKMFPAQDGFNLALVDCPPDSQDTLRRALNSQLGEYAADVQPTGYRLAQYLTIENTYLSTFQALGALGLMLGTIGLAVVLVRTAIERKSELALLASIGFRQSDRVRLVLSENLFLLLLGLFVGAACAILGIIPAFVSSAHHINYIALAGTLAGVVLIGTASSSIAVYLAGIHVSPADLRRE